MLIVHLYVFFGEIFGVYLGLLPIYWLGCLFIYLFIVIEFMSFLYISEIKPLLVASFANIFSQSVGCEKIAFD